MIRGKTISIYIPDSNPRGVKICEINNSIVKAIFIPRNKLDEVSNREDMKKPGIYFLFGGNDESIKPSVYIGEAENLLVRIKQHNISKDFWTTSVCFTSDKNNINKAHIKFLENFCCEEASKINKCSLENTVTPTRSTLTEQDRDFSLSFFDDLKVILSTLGYPIFEENRKISSMTFICKGKDANAIGEYTEDGMLVYKDSITNLQETNTIGTWLHNLRDSLIKENILEQQGNVLRFTEDYLFKSPSASAGVILGRRANGWIEWKNKQNKSLDDIYRKEHE